MPNSELHQKLTAIAQKFQLFECIECATALKQFLISQNISGKLIAIYTGNTKKPFCNIYHDRLQQNISTNGRHVGIAVEIEGRELIFDNLHPEGIVRVDWIKNLYSPIQDLGGDFQIEENTF